MQIELDACAQEAPPVIVVGDAGAVLGQEVQVRVGIRGSEANADATGLGDLEAIPVRIAPGAELGVAILRRPAAGCLKLLGLAAQGPEVGDLALRMLGRGHLWGLQDEQPAD